MNRLLAAPVGIAALLLLFFAAVSMGWIWLRMGRPDDPGVFHVAMLLLPLVVLGVAAVSASTDDIRLARMTWLVFMVGAIWTAVYAMRVGASAGSMAGVLGGPTAGAEALAPNDLPRALQRYEHLFEGTTGDFVRHDMGQVEYMRTAMFTDGSRLELYHLPFPELAANYARTWTRAFAGGASNPSRDSGGLYTANGQHARVYIYGNDVLALVGGDAALVRTRFDGWNLPPDLPPQATDPSFGKGFDQWPFGVAYGVMYFTMAVLFVSWLAVWTSEVKPMPGTFAADERTVRARLLSLPAQIPQLQVEEGPAADEMRVVYRYRSGARNMQVRLWLDEAHNRMRSRVYSGVAGDKPLTAEEARMRRGPTSATDLHPDADIIWNASWVAVPRSTETREQLRLRLVENEVELPRRVTETFATDVGVGAELLPHILTEIARQSGWTWRAGLLFY